MANSRGFTWSPFGIAWADNNWPNVICLAGPQVAAVVPAQWLGRNYWYGCGPDRSRNGGEASASVILLKADGGEVVSHPSGWTDGNLYAQRMAVGPGYFRPDGIRSTKDCAHRHVEESDEASPCIPFSLPRRLANRGVRWHTLVPKLQMPSEIREKDRIRRLRLVQYLTRAGKVAIPDGRWQPCGQMATLEVDLATLSSSFGNPGGNLATLMATLQFRLAKGCQQVSVKNPETFSQWMNPAEAVFLYLPFPTGSHSCLLLYRHDLSRLPHPVRDDGSPRNWWAGPDIPWAPRLQGRTGRAGRRNSFPTSSISRSRRG